MKVLSVFGTRPCVIKMAPLVNELVNRDGVESIVCITGQHRSLLDKLIPFFNIKVDYDLDLMKPNQSLTDLTASGLLKLEEVIKKVKPDVVLVHGDTTTAMMGSLAAYYARVKIGHVEAGLRTYDKYTPFPEETNRRIAGLVADFHFAPTSLTYDILIREGADNSSIFLTGNTVIDVLKRTILPDYTHPILEKLQDRKMVLLTAHRRESHGEGLRNIFYGIKRILEEFDDIDVVYPVHPNPNVSKLADEIFGNTSHVHLIRPLEVIDFHNFMARSHLILTDSGGIQEEAPFLGVPVVVLREMTDRPEGLETGNLIIGGTSEMGIYKTTKKVLSDHVLYAKMSEKSDVFGDGNASRLIADALISSLRDHHDF